MNRKVIKIVCIAVVGLVILLLLFRFSQAWDRMKVKKQPIPPISVSTIPVKIGTIADVVYATGTIRVVKREYCYFQTPGKVTFVKQISDPKAKGGKRDLREGDRVKTGELLAQVDPRTLNQDINVQKASMNQAEAAFNKAALDAKRSKKLWDNNAISKTDHERYNLEKLKGEATVKTAKAKLKQAEIALEHSKIFAPCDGIIAYMNVKKGYYFDTNQSNPQSESELLKSIPFVILHDNEMEMTANIPAIYMDKIKVGQPAFILRPTGDKPMDKGKVKAVDKIPAQVYSVNPAIDPGGRSIQVKIRTEQSGLNLRDGQFVSCWIVTQLAEKAMILPYNAIMYQDNQAYCFTAEKDETGKEVARLHQLKIGIEGESEVQAKSGISPNSRIIIEGNHRLVNDTQVKVIK